MYGCLNSAKSALFVVVNGSPTCGSPIRNEFKTTRSSFLFLFTMAMEGIHVAIKDVVANGCIQRALVLKDNFTIRHLFL